MTPKVAPCLWFNGEAEAAAHLYVSLFPRTSSVTNVTRHGEGQRFPAGTAMLVEFVVDGARWQALNGGPDYPHSAAVSFSVDCEDQTEVNRLWAAFIADGGAAGRCGWLTDRFGVSWQIVPRGMGAFLGGTDAAG